MNSKVSFLIFFFLFGLLLNSNLKAQNIEDIKRLIYENNTGTARFTSMGGAFGALGADISAINNNPASSAVYNFSNIGFSLDYSNTSNLFNYNGNNTENQFSTFNINQFGLTAIFKDDQNEDWSHIGFAFNYKSNTNYRDKIYINSNNNFNSIENYFLYYAQGLKTSNLILQNNETTKDLYQYLGQTNNLGFGAQQAFLGYQGYILNPIEASSDNASYVSNAKYSNGIENQFYNFHNGINKTATINFSARYKEKIYIGLNINFHEIEYDQTKDYYESGFDFSSNIQKINFQNKLVVIGKGNSIQLGLITKLNNSIRVGISYHSPTWYEFFDETSEYLISNHFLNDIEYKDIIDPDTINVFPKYNITIPSKIGISTAFVGTKGLISFEYITSNISSVILKDDSPNSFIKINNEIRQTFKKKNTLKIGAEYRILPLSLRIGFYNSGSPSKYFNYNNIKSLSYGFGIDLGNSMLDISIQNSKLKDSRKLYDKGLNESFDINRKLLNIIASYTFKL